LGTFCARMTADSQDKLYIGKSILRTYEAKSCKAKKKNWIADLKGIGMAWEKRSRSLSTTTEQRRLVSIMLPNLCSTRNKLRSNQGLCDTIVHTALKH